MKQFKLFAFVILALAIGLLAGRVGQGNTPALIDQADGPARLLILAGLGILLYGCLALAVYHSARYAGSDEPHQVHYVDRATANRWKGAEGGEPVDAPDTPPSGRPVRRTKW